MINGLIALLIAVIVVGIIAWLVTYIIDMLPIDGPFKQIAKVLVLLVAVLVILAKALPLLGLGSV
ncbi:hypothetical protein FJV76_14225 [Mesorhizobium sp. WSM4303]|uniref:hypothetical protein n=1 Tax=Mesorhizobium sp. WSM4303 TaxID=2589887 RepID=UPI00115F5772|nr:hypothetical protein [Mesorhizobium sp. WSM4303]TRD03790.1 hypothetical protein FJV76_14225 [Mesorhizobium sp. WSM4303]